jgi:hypothetical protein
MYNQFKYRRICSILGISLSVLITCYWLFAGVFHYWHLHEVKTEIHQYLKSNIPDSLLVSFTSEQLKEPSVRFIHSKEFELNSYKYDIVDSVKTAKGLVVRCVRDDKEKLVEEQLLSIYGHQNKPQKKPGSHSLGIFKFLLDQETSFITSFEATLVHGAVYQARDYRFSKFLESPPPEWKDRFLILS